MDEKRWLSCTDLHQLLNALDNRRRINQRKGRLFACACCRRIWHLLDDERSRVAVSLSELHAYGLATYEALRTARAGARQAMTQFGEQYGTWAESANERFIWGYGNNWHGTFSYRVFRDPERYRQAAALTAAYCAASVGGLGAAAQAREAEPDRQAALGAQADLLRDIYGNPFRRFPRTFRTTAAVRDLAEALSSGADCSFALHDALLEMGQPKLAEHFRTGAHGRGCWMADRILGKE